MVARLLSCGADPWRAPDAVLSALRAALDARGSAQGPKACLAALGRLLLPSLAERMAAADSLQDPALAAAMACSPRAVANARCAEDPGLSRFGATVDARLMALMDAGTLRSDAGAVLHALNALAATGLRPPRGELLSRLSRMSRRSTDPRAGRRAEMSDEPLEDARAVRADPCIGALRTGMARRSDR